MAATALRRRLRRRRPVAPAVDLADVQGLVMSGYGHLPGAAFLLFQVVDAGAARGWFGRLAPRLTTAEGRSATGTNVAVTADGLRALGAGDADLGTFSVAFREGMARPHRSRLLGDVDANDPSRWAWGGTAEDDGAVPAAAIHVLLLLYRPLGQLEAERDREVADAEASGLRLVHQLTPEPLPGAQKEGKFGSEHFGFIDGMGQPVLDIGGGRPPHGGSGGPPVPAGEFVLGYPNAYGLEPTPPHVGPPPAGDAPRLGRNGSYLVLRQLAQDVAGFWRSMDEASRRPDGTSDEHARTLLAAKLVGRWPSGAPLVLAPDADDPALATENVFSYADDPHGLRCPFGAHVRRANPRDALLDDRATAIELADRHRLVRRGRVYGKGLAQPLAGDDGVERGLLFMCLNASIERQFEFVQHSWCGNPKFSGLYDEGDPLLGTGAERTFTVPDSPVRRRVTGLPQFVTTRGGAYFFLPGVAAVAALGR